QRSCAVSLMCPRRLCYFSPVASTGPTWIYTLSLHDALPIFIGKNFLGDFFLIHESHIRNLRDSKKRKSKRNTYIVREIGNQPDGDRKSTRLNSSHVKISYAVFCVKKKI